LSSSPEGSSTWTWRTTSRQSKTSTRRYNKKRHSQKITITEDWQESNLSNWKRLLKISTSHWS
jgi:hypothetical protein